MGGELPGLFLFAVFVGGMREQIFRAILNQNIVLY